jgi:hypothetical protein
MTGMYLRTLLRNVLLLLGSSRWVGTTGQLTIEGNYRGWRWAEGRRWGKGWRLDRASECACKQTRDF